MSMKAEGILESLHYEDVQTTILFLKLQNLTSTHINIHAEQKAESIHLEVEIHCPIDLMSTNIPARGLKEFQLKKLKLHLQIEPTQTQNPRDSLQNKVE